jgi:hypothetical protein
MAYEFRGLVNRICKAFNEVELTSSQFIDSTTLGVYSEYKDAVNRAIFDICMAKLYDWPFLYSSQTFNTASGTNEYSVDSSVMSADWTSFTISRTALSVTSITRSGTTATVTTSASHNFESNDRVYISGATPAGYNGNVSITVTGATTFTYTVDSTLTTPATGTIVVYPPYEQQKLTFISWEKYQEYDQINDRNSLPTEYSVPSRVTRKPNNSTLVLSPIPNRVYRINYDSFTFPTPLEDPDDVPVIPSQFEQVIIDRALHYAYMFRDNFEQAQIAEDRAKKGIENMHRILVPMNKFMRIGQH